MARINASSLASRYQARLDRSKNDYFTVKRKGVESSKITQGTIDRIASDESTTIEVRENNARQIASAMNQSIASALEEIGLAAERFAKAETPVDTGRLRNSITHAISMDEEAVYIGTNVEYAPYIEMGTSTRDGKWMLKHAAENHGTYYRSIMKKHLENG